MKIPYPVAVLSLALSAALSMTAVTSAHAQPSSYQQANRAAIKVDSCGVKRSVGKNNRVRGKPRFRILR